MKNPIQSRRRFMANMLALAGGSAVPLSLNLAAMGAAAAAGASDYKAIVCVFLSGGNDNFNTVLPTDSASWSEYVRLRTTTDAGSIALPAVGAAGGVLPIAPATAQAGRSFALHPSLKAVKGLFEGGRAAIVANVGPLIQPITLAQYKAGTAPVPAKLFSHNDQQATWQSMQTESAQALGWGGRMADMLASANSNASFSCISNAGNALFLSGRTAQQLQVNGTQVPPIQALTGYLYGVPSGPTTVRNIITTDNWDNFQRAHTTVVKNAIATQAAMASAILPMGAGGVADPTAYVNPVTGAAAVNPLAVQLQTVARIIGGRSSLGANRQVFYVSLGSFDSHDNQRVTQADLLARLDHAMAYFDNAMASLQGADMRKQVTLFTASDFGRTFTSNGDGSDHGWGSHHFVMGGAVKGGDIYGTMPVTGVGHDLDVGSGALLPTQSVDQYAATMASWFGLSASQIADVFPNLAGFNTPNLGFMA